MRHTKEFFSNLLLTIKQFQRFQFNQRLDLNIRSIASLTRQICSQLFKLIDPVIDTILDQLFSMLDHRIVIDPSRLSITDQAKNDTSVAGTMIR